MNKHQTPRDKIIEKISEVAYESTDGGTGIDIEMIERVADQILSIVVGEIEKNTRKQDGFADNSDAHKMFMGYILAKQDIINSLTQDTINATILDTTEYAGVNGHTGEPVLNKENK